VTETPDQMLTDYHVHLRQDDLGATADSHFTAGNVARYRAAADQAGIAELGFAEHMYRFAQALEIWDHPFWKEWALDDLDRYCEVVAAGPAKLGIEADFVPGAEDRTAALLDARPFDFVIGSIHFIGDRSLDTEEFTIWDERSDPDEIWRRYFETLALAARSGLFDVLAHPDLVKVWGRGRPLPDRDLRFFYEPAVEAIAESGIAVELSTAGLRKPVGELYPAPAFAQLCAEAGVPFALSSDAHLPEQVGFGYGQAIELLKRLGVGEICAFEGRRRRLAPLDGAAVGENPVR
jgi:histidinol-phosphatase (PHP family)